MSVKYQDFQSLQEDTNPSDASRPKNQIKGILMSRRIPEPSTGLMCLLSAICTGLIFIIIILVVTITREASDQTERSLGVRLRNVSVEVHSRVDQLYEDSYRMMEKLIDFEEFMKNFRKQNVTNKVQNIEAMVRFFLSDEVAGSLASDNQRILGSVGLLTDGLRGKNGSRDPLCDSGWTHFGLSCYFLSRSARPWDYANTHCQNKQGHLVVINSQEEKEFLGNLSRSQSVWVGLSVEDGVWRWVDGTSYEKSPKFWRNGQWYYVSISSSPRSRLCAELEGDEGWTASYCRYSYQYVCEKKISRTP